MGQRHLRIVARRFAVHERRRPERRLADEGGAEHIRDRWPFDAVGRAKAHEQIVWVLHVDVRDLLITFAGLKELRRATERDAFAARREGVDPFHAAVAGVDQPPDGQRLACLSGSDGPDPLYGCRRA